jgi:glycosyltransferase involved in cell wall biosynthesis
MFGHAPNRDGIHWFVKCCWPQVKREMPDVRLRLVGEGSNGPLAPSGQDIEGLGWLANPSEEIKTWSAMVVPIRTGAGSRVKIVQAFSHKCPIVSTSFGALGYGKVDGREMLLADSAQAFAGACLKVIREPEKAAQMAEVAWVTFLEKWTWDAICPRVWAAAEECLRLSGTG